MSTSHCPCGLKIPFAAFPYFCPCGARIDTNGNAKNVSSPAVFNKTGLQDRSAQKPNHWLTLHQYAPANQHNWDPSAARAWFQQWKAGISKYVACAACQEHFDVIQNELKPDYSSPEAFAHRAWQWHDRVSERIGKPRISWDECQSLFGVFAPAECGRHNFVTALSQLPRHLERQQVCLDSWRKFGAKIFAMNTGDEIEALREQYPQVEEWVESNELSTAYDRPTQLIRNLSGVARSLDDKIYLINSDIEVHGPQSLLPDTDAQLLGLRWNYQPGEDRHFAREFQWGIDLMSFTPEQSLALPFDAPYAIGQPMWDYALPYYAMRAGHSIQFLHDRLLYHEDHDLNWSEEAWILGANWICDRTELEARDYVTSGLLRASLDPATRYDTPSGMYVQATSGARPSVRPLDYQEWCTYTHPRGTFRTQ